MARILSQTLIRDTPTRSSDLIPSNPIIGGLSRLPSPSALLLNLRFRSNRSGKAVAQLLEVDLAAETSEVVEIVGPCRLKDAMCGIIARRSAPLWLPFVPGSSYWVPPKEKPDGGNSVKEVEALSFRSVRGWPLPAFFAGGGLPNETSNDELEITLNLEDSEVNDGKSSRR